MMDDDGCDAPEGGTHVDLALGLVTAKHARHCCSFSFFFAPLVGLFFGLGCCSRAGVPGAKSNLLRSRRSGHSRRRRRVVGGWMGG